MIDLLYITIGLGVLIIVCVLVNIGLCMCLVEELRKFSNKYKDDRYVDMSSRYRAAHTYITELQEGWKIKND